MGAHGFLTSLSDGVMSAIGKNPTTCIIFCSALAGGITVF